jgi:transposase-like protein
MMIYSECDQTATTNNTVTNSKTGQQQQNTTASPFSSSSSSLSEYMANGVSPKYPAASFSVNSLLNPATAFGVLEETYRKHHQHPNAQTQFNPYQVSQSIDILGTLKKISKSVYLFRTTIMERAVNLTLNWKRSFSNKRIAADQQVITRVAQAQRRQQHRRLQQLQQTRQSRYNRPHHQ